MPQEDLERHTVRFLGRTIGEFKHIIFHAHFISTKMASEKNITQKDLEVLHDGDILDDDFDIEYCINTHENPLVVYVPGDIDYAEFKYQAKFCADKVQEMRKVGIENMNTRGGRYLDLQYELDQVMSEI